MLQKVKRLIDLASPSGAFSTLREAAQHLGAHLPADLQAHFLPQPEYHYLQETYQLHVDPSVMELQLLKTPMAGEIYRGVVRGVVGQLLVLQASDRQLYIVPVNQLVGYLLTIGAGIGRIEIQQQPQSVRLSREA